MSKVPCGGFNLDDNFLSMNENGELSLVGGSEDKAYKQLVTDGSGNVEWEDRLAYEITYPETFICEFRTTTGSSSIKNIPLSKPLIVGMAYLVTVDGVETTEICEGASQGSTLNLYKDGKAVGVIITTVDSPLLATWQGTPSFSYTVKIVQSQYSEVNQINQKYIPPQTIYLHLSQNDGSWSIDKTYDEIQSFLMNGINVKIKIGNYAEIAEFIGTLSSPNLFFISQSGLYDDFTFNIIIIAPDNLVDVDSIRVLPSQFNTEYAGKYLLIGNNGLVEANDLIIRSSTSGSTKNFKITVDDTGTITATEV